MERNLVSARLLGRGRRLAGILGRVLPVALLAFAASACTCGNDLADYRGWAANGRNPCEPWQNDMREYAQVIRGVPPCPAMGPCNPCEPSPCDCPPAPCPPPPCAPAIGAGPSDMPPEARPGEAWCRVCLPPVYETVTERVMTICPTQQSVWTPPGMETKLREVCVRPPCTQEIDLPGAYRTETYCCETSPGRTEHRPRPCTCEEQAAGQCQCFDVITVPPCTEVRTRQICITPPTRKTVYQPALYRTEAVLCEKCPGFWTCVEMPGVYETRSRQVCVQPERWEWRRNPACTLPNAATVPMPTTPPAPPEGTLPPPPPSPVPPPPPPPVEPPAPPVEPAPSGEPQR